MIYCFGIIPVRRQGNGWEVFVLQHQKGHWGFPKGHPEKGESPEQVAARELLEETGLSIAKFLQVNPLIEQYFINDNGVKAEKSVTYFLAEVEGTVKLLQNEIAASKWISFDDAISILTYEQSRKLCQEAKSLCLFCSGTPC